MSEQLLAKSFIAATLTKIPVGMCQFTRFPMTHFNVSFLLRNFLFQWSNNGNRSLVSRHTKPGKLTSLGMMGNQLRVPLKPLSTIVLTRPKKFQGALNCDPMMPKRLVYRIAFRLNAVILADCSPRIVTLLSVEDLTH